MSGTEKLIKQKQAQDHFGISGPVKIHKVFQFWGKFVYLDLMWFPDFGFLRGKLKSLPLFVLELREK